MTVPKRTDASGRGPGGDFLVPFPAVMHPYLESEIELVADVMRHAKSLTQGEYLHNFEADFREHTGAPHAFAVDNCTNALRLSAILCRLGPDDEVIIPAYTFCATAIPFAATGARIVWADIDPKLWTVCPKDIGRKITSRTKVIVVVHLLGMPADMDPILEIAAAHGIKVVEDCAQAPGARYKGKAVGTLGDFGCFSFHAAKNITTLGEGGMLTVRSDSDATLVPGLRHNGVRPFPADRERYWAPAMSQVDLDLEGVWANNFCIGEVQCALGSALLKRLDQINDSLRAQAAALRARLSGIPELSFQEAPEGHHHVAHTFVARFHGEKLGKTREDFMDLMTTQYGIRLIVQYYPLYRYPLFQKTGFGEADCPNLEDFWFKSFSYPWWCGIPEETLDYMARCTRETLEQLRQVPVRP